MTLTLKEIASETNTVIVTIESHDCITGKGALDLLITESCNNFNAFVYHFYKGPIDTGIFVKDYECKFKNRASVSELVSQYEKYIASLT